MDARGTRAVLRLGPRRQNGPAWCQSTGYLAAAGLMVLYRPLRLEYIPELRKYTLNLTRVPINLIRVPIII